MPKQLTPQLFIGDILHEWDVNEYEQYERPRNWYLVVGGLGLALVLFGVFTNNFLFTLIILLAGIIVFMQSQQTPLQVPVALTNRGIIIGRRFYSYDEFTEFYILFIPGQVKALFLETSSILQPRIQLPLDDVDATDIRETLRMYIEENFEKEEEPVSEQMRKMWRIH